MSIIRGSITQHRNMYIVNVYLVAVGHGERVNGTSHPPRYRGDDLEGCL